MTRLLPAAPQMSGKQAAFSVLLICSIFISCSVSSPDMTGQAVTVTSTTLAGYSTMTSTYQSSIPINWQTSLIPSYQTGRVRYCIYDHYGPINVNRGGIVTGQLEADAQGLKFYIASSSQHSKFLDSGGCSPESEYSTTPLVSKPYKVSWTAPQTEAIWLVVVTFNMAASTDVSFTGQVQSIGTGTQQIALFGTTTIVRSASASSSISTSIQNQTGVPQVPPIYSGQVALVVSVVAAIILVFLLYQARKKKGKTTRRARAKTAFCINCGATISKDSKFCKECGAKQS
jgi:hypothetical protein